jgi:hypothetical protein
MEEKQMLSDKYETAKKELEDAIAKLEEEMNVDKSEKESHISKLERQITLSEIKYMEEVVSPVHISPNRFGFDLGMISHLYNICTISDKDYASGNN